MLRGILGFFWRVFECVLGLGRYAWVFLRSLFQSKATTAARIVALESQLDMCLRQREGKRFGRFSESFKSLWVILSWFLNGWERLCHAMKPRTVVGWKDRVFKWFWRCISRGEVGRKPISVELRKLIRWISRQNPLWGAAKIRDVIVDMGFRKLDVRTVRKYMPRRAFPKDPSGNWLTFIRNHMDVSWAMDLWIVRTIEFKALYVLVIIEHGSRRIRHWNVTDSPSMDWIIQQLREATPFGEVPRFLHRDNDRLYGKGVSKFLKDSFIEDVRSAFGSPWQNPFVERFFRSLRRELLDHVIIFHEEHLRNLISQYVNWYENFRLHQGLEGKSPVSGEEEREEIAAGKIVSIPILGSLHHRYERLAA